MHRLSLDLVHIIDNAAHVLLDGWLFFIWSFKIAVGILTNFECMSWNFTLISDLLLANQLLSSLVTWLEHTWIIIGFSLSTFGLDEIFSVSRSSRRLIEFYIFNFLKWNFLCAATLVHNHFLLFIKLRFKRGHLLHESFNNLILHHELRL